MKQAIGYVYIVRNTVNTKVYIGETLSPVKNRLRQHFNAAFCKNHRCRNCHFFRAIRKYGIDKFYIEILETVCRESRTEVKEIIQSLEKQYIAKYDSFKNGYNSDSGGNGGKVISEYSRKLMSERKKNDPLIREHLSKIRKQISYPVKVYDYYSGEFLEECSSGKALAVKYNIDSSFVTKCCKHPDKISYATINSKRCAIRYASDEYKPRYKYIVTDDIHSFIDYCIDAQDANKKYGSRPECIERCCKGKILSSGKKDGHKLIWSYYEERSN